MSPSLPPPTSSQATTSSQTIDTSKMSSSLSKDYERKEALTKCLLSQYRYCAGGVVSGAAYTIVKRSTVKPGPWPMLAGGFVGTLGDFVYGYFVECAHLRDDSKKIFQVKDNVGGRE